MDYRLKEEKNHVYIAIDLKSFYASVECQERGLDPLTTNLVVADASRTEKTICLAVSPSLKAYHIPGRARLFEVVARVREVNAERKSKAPGRHFTGKSFHSYELDNNPSLELDYITATPRMALYMKCSTEIYQIYLKYVAPEDIHIYSIDEVFMDVTSYLCTYKMTPREFAMRMIQDVMEATGITATAGVGSNLYLCKVAMDIVAKHVDADENGVRLAELDELTYRKELWNHRPLTDFWRIGHGYAKKLENYGLMTMGDIARCSLGGPKDYYNEDLLYKMFGINAELLIDHAWGWEPCTIADVKAYKPENNSLSSGQVLQGPYSFEKAKLIVREMTDLLVLDLVDKKLVTDKIVLTVGYDVESLKDPQVRAKYKGAVTVDYFGREVPKAAQGTSVISKKTSSTKLHIDAVMDLYDRIVHPDLLVRRLNVAAINIISEDKAKEEQNFEQLDLFTFQQEEPEDDSVVLEREKKIQQALLDIKKKYGKNAVLKGMNLEEGAMTMERNRQIGGHKA